MERRLIAFQRLMPPRQFAVTWDYRCPFARNAHEHIIEGLKNGADWNVTFVPFSLGQAHVEPGDRDVWDEPHRDSGLLALTAAIAVRDFQPTSFLDVHQALFDARHSGRNLRDESVLAAVLNEAGADGDTAMDEVDSGRPLERVRAEHTKAATEHCVWGVPTFIVGNEAAFVRLMERPCGNGEMARSTIERTVDLLGGWPGLNEFKHTSVAR